MAQQVTTYTVSSAAAQPVTTGSSQAAAPAITYSQAAPIATYQPADATSQPIATYPPQTTEGLPAATSMVVSYGPVTYAPQTLDHSQGRWFAPGEPLPPGFVATVHPEGHLEPQAEHAMTEAVKSMKGFTGAAKADKKKSKKKKSS
eukprot:CAMPEP_0181443172 /NCGR_PEP_ID=MMETSP1110-20121109/24415_1 /TAXON_ID=174948 /ORGANISM="Symbiodinium sp., Strain CCMP421" /LENGTH=145 /DNA_ID=CAMNT_0023567137 /DNA_START=52 /DNA_END=485 /DNA_ORIENTATION=+